MSIKIGVLAMVLALSGGAAWWYLPQGGMSLCYTTAAVKRGDIVATIRATGTIEPVEVVDVGAQVAGRISSFGRDREGKAIDYGSVVEEGVVLAKIDESVYGADLEVAKAQWEREKANEASAEAGRQQAKAKLLQAEADWSRAIELNATEILSSADYDLARANFEVANANVAVAEAAVAQAKATTVQARAAVDKAERNLAFCSILSPVSGVIIDRRVSIGQTVVASLNAPSLFLMARDLRKMQIWVSVNEADVGRISRDMPVTFRVDAFPDLEFQGAVGKVRLNATMNQNVVLYTVEVDFDNPNLLLLPYLTAHVSFVLKRESDVLLVPNAALRWAPSLPAQVSSRGVSADPPGAPAARPDRSRGLKPSRRTLWLKGPESVRPMEVVAGISDGVNTAVASDELQEGSEVVTGEVFATQADVKTPFLPKATGR